MPTGPHTTGSMKQWRRIPSLALHDSLSMSFSRVSRATSAPPAIPCSLIAGIYYPTPHRARLRFPSFNSLFAPTHKLNPKEAAIFSDQISPRSGSRSDSGYPKRTFRDAFDLPDSISSKKYRSSLTKFRNTIGRSQFLSTTYNILGSPLSNLGSRPTSPHRVVPAS